MHKPRRAEETLARGLGVENVLLTPHYAGGAKSGLLAELGTIIRNCQAALNGCSIVHEIMPD